MVIIGERINTSNPVVKEAVETKDRDFIKKVVKAQLDAGADLIDVNCGLSHTKEAEDMMWLIDIISELGSIPLCLDSPNPKIIEDSINRLKSKVLINSITAEEKRYKPILPLVVKNECDIIALTIDESGIPETAEDRFRIAKILYEIITEEGIKAERIYIDPLVRPISSQPKQAVEFLKSIPMIKSLKGVKVVCGISNISYGLPKRSKINSAFLAMSLQQGIDAAIVDPLDKNIISAIKSSEAILNRDRFCMNFINAYRKGII